LNARSQWAARLRRQVKRLIFPRPAESRAKCALCVLSTGFFRCGRDFAEVTIKAPTHDGSWHAIDGAASPLLPFFGGVLHLPRACRLWDRLFQPSAEPLLKSRDHVPAAQIGKVN
jgi:hypothetical protein